MRRSMVLSLPLQLVFPVEVLPNRSRDVQNGTELCSAGNPNNGGAIVFDQLGELVHGCSGAANCLAGLVVSTCQNLAFVCGKA